MSEMMTIEEARKILGEKYKNMDDEDIQRLICDLTFIARETIRDLRSKRAEQAKEPETKNT